ncbi:LacI family DNA-binding transcriptional regulator [Tabrizicola fusiformis]|jgi:LacI family transcriptional regulator|uniref:LacI family DNA-binding transcriptional regulator n=1 Tax=Tabrizicola sp. SY72 TaxID=2741673 RepID=UPI001571D26F|nr:LacI family DNA-binding transcriptional regulator [Tabrizicola sp. SY72]NTT88017.1 substrate-binding domain-containing protein [Tabrizicola sp. SY72]
MGRPTINDLATAAGLSTSTVKRVLHGGGVVRSETMSRVLAAAEEIGFYGVGSLRGRIASSKPRHKFGLVMQQPNQVFGKAVAAGLEAAARAVPDRDIQLSIDLISDLSPEFVAARIMEMGSDVEAMAVVAAEHPIVTEAINQFSERGGKVLAFISPLSAPSLIGYVGLDGWKVGRTSAWAFRTACRQPGKIGILVGTHRYRCHELNEAGFRSYFREHVQDFALLEAVSTFEADGIAREVTERLLREHEDLQGIYVSGGGMAGVLGAVRDAGKSEQVVIVGYDLSDVTRTGLLDGSINLVISHPFEKLGQEAIAAMIRAGQSGPMAGLQTIHVQFDIYTPENL